MNRKISLVKILLCVLLVGVMLLGLAGCATSKSTYDFDRKASNGVPGWDIYDYNKKNSETPANITLIESDIGGRAVKIESTEDNDARIYREIKVKEGSTYLVSVMVKTENVEGGAGANISGNNSMERSDGVFGSSEGWTEHSVYVLTGSGQKVMPLSLGLGGYSAESKGVAYFDNLTVKQVSSVPEGAKTITIRDKDETSDTEVSVWLKLLFVLAIVGGAVYCFAISNGSDKYNYKHGRQLSYEVGRLDKRDAIIMLSMTVVCGIFSFVNLGSLNGTPSSYWKAGQAGEYITVSFKEAATVTKIAYYSGIPSSSGQLSIEYKDSATGEFTDVLSGGSKVTITAKNHTDFYVWSYKSPEAFTTDTIKVKCDSAGVWINEIGFYKTGANGELELIELDLSTVKAVYQETEESQKAENLFDEQSDVRSVKSKMNSTYFDEIYHPRTAYEHLNGLSIYEWTHPPLGKSIISIGIMIFGMNTFGWRFMGTLFGVLLVPLMYAFGKKVFKKPEWAFLTAFLMMFDFMRLSQTRLATIDTYACFFTLAMIYFMYDYFVQKSYEVEEKRSLYSLFMCGLMFGLGAASKWTCIYTGAALAIIFFASKLAELFDCKDGRAGRLTVKRWFNTNFLYTCGICILAFVIIPGVIYVLSYIPYMASKPNMNLLEIVIDNQESMYNYHNNLLSSHSYGSEWYTWPVSGYNIFYHNGDSSTLQTDDVVRVMAMGNPLVWWLGVPAFFAAAYFAWRNKDKRMGVFVMAYLMQYAPWFIVNRVCYIYHYFTCVPFTMFMIVYVIRELTEKRKILPKWSVWIYMAMVLIVFIWFYPALTGLSISSEWLDSMKWFSTWMF